MNGLSWPVHLAVFVALVLNLWLGGDLIEAWLGHTARTVSELALILGYMTLVLGMRVPLRFWRRPAEGSSNGTAEDTPPPEDRRD
jgi:type VI protein secretion system component VasK